MSAPFDPSKLDLDINNIDSPEKPQENATDTSTPKPQTEDSGKVPDSSDSTSVGKVADQVTSADPLAQEMPIPEISQDTKPIDTGETAEIPEIPVTETTTAINDNDILSEGVVEPKEKIEKPAEKIIDINISSLQDLSYLLIDEKYDFVILDPSESEVKITFKTDGVEKSVKYIKYPNYSNILLKIKQVTKMSVESSDQEREGKGTIQIKDVAYNVMAKIAPGGYGEKVYLKLKENTQKKATKKTKKTSMSTIFGFLGAILFVSLVLGGAFITFIILNAQGVEDVNFFRSLGINLNDINTFISRIVTFIFSIVLFIETVVLAIFLFKFVWTKKEFKKKRVLYGMISTILLIVTFSSASAWMIIDQKIKALPNWQELAYGDIQIYDNSMLTSDAFDKAGALLTNTNNLIGPVTIKYDVSLFESNEEKKGFEVKKYIWTIGNEVIEELNPTLIREFSEEGNYEISLVVEQIDLKGDTITKEVENIPGLSITHVVDVQESITTGGGKIVEFDASSVQELGKVEWYFGEDLEKPVWDGYQFKPTQIFFEEKVVVLSIQNDATERINKVFIVGEERGADIDGDIEYIRSPINDLEYTLKVINPQTSFGDGFLESFEWKIDDKTVKKEADPIDLEKSSQIKFEFESYGDNEVSVVLTDSSGQTTEITKIINIPRNVALRENLSIWNNDQVLENIRYIEKANEYFVDELGIPTLIKLDARKVRAENVIYSLREVSWDIGNDGNIDGSGKTFEYDVLTEGNHTISVNYKFVHRRDEEDIINLKEFIYVEGVRKEAIVDFRIEADTDYVPVTVRFDASKSTIKDDDVVKFEYDYGNGIVEVRDAINPGHRYTEPGDYVVKLTITGRSGRKYSAEKSLILKPEPQEVKIGVSLKNAPVGQGIDFSSADSDGQITEYFWNFGDGNTSIEANPTHSYSKPGTYEVELRVNFSNNNILVDKTQIEIYEE